MLILELEKVLIDFEDFESMNEILKNIKMIISFKIEPVVDNKNISKMIEYLEELKKTILTI